MHSNEKGDISPDVLKVHKKRCETLADLLIRVRKEKNIPEETKITYAGRLDPMAEGLVILLLGNAVHKKELYQSLDKKYIFSVLFGISTDTFDVLGRVEKIQIKSVDEIEIKNVIDKVSKMDLTYPPYSSKLHEGAPLFIHARENTLPKNLPMQSGKIKEFNLVSLEQKGLANLIQEIIGDIEKVNGDFRQKDIISDWQKVKETTRDIDVSVATFEATVTTGTYIRSIAKAIGETLNVPSCALSINRLQIQDMSLE